MLGLASNRGDAQTDTGELLTLAEAGVKEFKLAYTNNTTTDQNGNEHKQTSTYTTTAGMRTWPVQLEGADKLPVFSRHFDHVLASLPELQAAARGQALVSVDLENGLVRHVPLVDLLMN